MTPAPRQRRALSIVVAAIPLTFALIRAIRTGNDFRYFWVALGSLAGAEVVIAASRRFAPSMAVAVIAIGVFVAATLVALVVALLIGTKLGLGILVVAASFGCCFAIAAALR